MKSSLNNLIKFVLKHEGYVSKTFEHQSSVEFSNIVNSVNHLNIDTVKDILNTLICTEEDEYFILLKEFINDDNNKEYLVGREESNNYIFKYTDKDISDLVIRIIPIFDVTSSRLHIRIDLTIISAIMEKVSIPKVKAVVS